MKSITSVLLHLARCHKHILKHKTSSFASIDLKGWIKNYNVLFTGWSNNWPSDSQSKYEKKKRKAEMQRHSCKSTFSLHFLFHIWGPPLLVGSCKKAKPPPRWMCGLAHWVGAELHFCIQRAADRRGSDGRPVRLHVSTARNLPTAQKMWGMHMPPPLSGHRGTPLTPRQPLQHIITVAGDVTTGGTPVTSHLWTPAACVHFL